MNSNTIIIVSVLGVGAVGILYFVVSSSSSNSNTAASVNAAQQAALLKAAQQGSTSAVGSSATGLAGLVNSIGGLFKSSSSTTTTKTPAQSAAAAVVPKKTVDDAKDYIEDADPTTLYDVNGNVIGSLDDYLGLFVSTNGSVVASKDGTPIISYDSVTGNYQEVGGLWYNSAGDEITGDFTTTTQKGTSTMTAAGVPIKTVDSSGNYIEDADPYTLYNVQGFPIGDFDSAIGMFVSSNNAVIAASDGTPVMSYDGNTGNYQENSGQWYDSGGNPISSDV